MKKLLLTVGLVAAVSAAHAQGTVNLSNSGLQRLSSASSTGTILGVLPQTTAGAFLYSFYYGASAGSLTLLNVSGVNSTSTTGVIASATDGVTPLSLVAIPGFDANTMVFMQVTARSADGLWQAATPVKNVGPLGAAPSGPAFAIWQSNTGTSTAKFKPNELILQPVPEPSTMALAGLAAASLLIFRRRQ